VEQLLSLAEVALRDEVQREVVQKEFEAAFAQLEALGTIRGEPSPEEISAFFAVSAAVSALGNCSHKREPLFGRELDVDSANHDLDPYEYDTAGWAAVAYAHGYGNWDLPLDPEKSKEFWEWWLLEAIPQSWQVASEN